MNKKAFPANIKIHQKAMIMKAAWYWHKMRQTDQ